MRLARQIGLVALLAAVAGGAVVGWQAFRPFEAANGAPAPDGKPRTVTVETAPVVYRDTDVTIEAVGSTRALRTVEITPLASGRIEELNFTAGQEVKAGDALLKLDDDIQRADLMEAEAQLKDARDSLERSETLRRTSSVSKATVDSLRTKVTIAEAERDRAARRLRDRVVTAPFDGVVSFSNVEVGGRVEDGDVIAVLDDLSAVQVEFSMPETMFGEVGIGTRVVANAAAFPDREFAGTIAFIDSRVDPVSRSFKARATIANRDRALPPGMFVHLSVVLNAEHALAVPEEAVVVDGSRAFVYVAEARDGVDLAEKRIVSLGHRSFGFVQITDGLRESERVIVRGHQKVRPGTPLKVMDEGPAAGPPKPQS